jgi:hypothetical protein
MKHNATKIQGISQNIYSFSTPKSSIGSLGSPVGVPFLGSHIEGKSIRAGGTAYQNKKHSFVQASPNICQSSSVITENTY